MLNKINENFITGDLGIFNNVNDAVKAASDAQKQLMKIGLSGRTQICHIIRNLVASNTNAWGEFEFNETKLGRVEHKIAKLFLVQRVLGTEFLRTTAHSGDAGLSIDEAAPWGVIGVVTPVTHVIPTITSNAITIISAGNSLVINPHPSGYKSAAIAAQSFNQEIANSFGIRNLISVIAPPTLDTANELFTHEGIAMLLVTGGPAVAQVALQQKKKAIVAGPGNPPVVVDETADLNNAASCIVAGGGFDNNLLCIGEKEVFVLDDICNDLKKALSAHHALELNQKQIEALTKQAFTQDNGKFLVNKNFIGKNASFLAEAAGIKASTDTLILFGEVPDNHLFVAKEQMMPFIPIVRTKSFEEAVSQAVKYEHGYHHTSIIHSRRSDRITYMGNLVKTTLFIANGACTAGVGLGGEGYTGFSIATPTGEGIVTPLNFTRFRRISMCGMMRMI